MAHEKVLSKQDEILEEQTRFYNYGKKRLTGMEAFKLFLWNPEKKAFMGRTGASWSKIGLFYLIFYGMLAALVAICMWVFLQTLNPRIPKWQLDRSIIGTNPGLGFRPMPTNNIESSLIWFQGSNRTNYQPWVDNLSRFLDGYYTPSKIAKGSGQIKTCSHSDFPHDDEVCEVDVREWGKCNKDEFFDYHRSSPCIFLKLNRIYGWTPDYYLYDHELPPDMPKQLKAHIKSLNNTRDRQNIWVSCEGETPADKEYIGSISYYPKSVQGFPGYYFPYLNREGYLSPLVAVRFERPVPGIVINVECRAWAKNIRYGRSGRVGSVHFELLID
ncbi:sodium/potassium-transporting ATPase subunit beta-2 [Dendroctonus ponderosae]|uniref:sodium/potassium-transporting ATPase subunit beta-2 n=1 Tax=Dendroctonus ponderosae TaxID=77166 RepID=UPI002035BFD8|nr:sodium/potassium-transporting ATPase subunit beta-2 [Dendroctonus ponderosae]XP_048518691.1 sodium/potassium-transporting ATPase subunit beta-2 [Dendroctonus ponderosae]